MKERTNGTASEQVPRGAWGHAGDVLTSLSHLYRSFWNPPSSAKAANKSAGKWIFAFVVSQMFALLLFRSDIDIGAIIALVVLAPATVFWPLFDLNVVSPLTTAAVLIGTCTGDAVVWYVVWRVCRWYGNRPRNQKSEPLI